MPVTGAAALALFAIVGCSAGSDSQSPASIDDVVDSAAAAGPDDSAKGGNTCLLDYRSKSNRVAVSGIAPTSLKMFRMSYRPVTDEDMKKFNEEIDASKEEGLETESRKEMAKDVAGMIGAITKAYRDVDGLAMRRASTRPSRSCTCSTAVWSSACWPT